MADDRIRMTEQRQVILDELRKVKTHPTADEVYAMVRRRLPRISLGTVYRNLDLLSESGLVRKLDSGPQMRFDADTTDHYHVRCARCGRVRDLHVEPIPGLDELVETGHEFDIIGYRLEFIGICSSCRRTGKKGEKPV